MSLRSISTVAARAFALVLCALVPGTLPAVDSVDLAVGDVHAPSWSATGIRARLDLNAAGHAEAHLSIANAQFPAPLGAIRDISIVCAEPVVRSDLVSCPGARVTATHARFGRLQFVTAASFDRARAALDIDIQRLKIATGTWTVRARWHDTGWQLSASAKRLPIAGLRRFLTPWVTLPADLAMDGALSPEIAISGRKSVDSIRIRASADALTLNNADGTLATDKLALDLDALLKPIATGYRVDSTIALTSGQAYRDPIFLDLGKNRIDLEWSGDWNSTTERLAVARFSAVQAGVLRAQGAAAVAPFAETALASLDLTLELAQFPGLYAIYLQPFLVNSDLKDLATKGALRGTMQIREGNPVALDLDLDAIDFDDTAGRMAMHGLSGHVAWRSAIAQSQPSSIAWQSGKAYGFSGASARIEFVAGGREFRMLEPTRLPVFDGGLAIAAFEVRDAALPTMTLLFDATLDPISMRRICQALGWPEFAGTVAGRIPRLTLKDKVLSVDGDLEARVFDGRMVISKLRLADPLGDWPQLSASVDFERLDLQAVTGTFSFGEITGRLSGYIHSLELFNWRPIAFDAVLATSQGDKSEHRISQRAVSNISAIGGGSSGGTMQMLSGGVLRFFENFKYDKLGLSCRLADEICLMQGIGPASNGYYIVKGHGIPRIDVIGSAGRIDWPQLVANLKAATKAGPATTERTQ